MLLSMRKWRPRVAIFVGQKGQPNSLDWAISKHIYVIARRSLSCIEVLKIEVRR